ncbi:hypothetical protein Barb7_01651 [Bacteroidales bacterium Barb7]|nr:hypothetical protein Barb7_01651 [Bacteroidales bacterium Barb7]
MGSGTFWMLIIDVTNFICFKRSQCREIHSIIINQMKLLIFYNNVSMLQIAMCYSKSF